jgi:ribosomal protein S18 acetylase RimI-like enzyme
MKMKDNYTYKEAFIRDLKDLKELSHLSYKEFACVLDQENWEKLYKGLNDEQRLAELIIKSKVFVCSDNNLIVGMALLVPSGNPTHIYPTDWSYIRLVGVNPSYRGKGIAKKLTLKCIEQARSLGEKVIALHTSEFMHTARKLYEGLGFEKVRELEPIFGKTYWLYKLELTK